MRSRRRNVSISYNAFTSRPDFRGGRFFSGFSMLADNIKRLQAIDDALASGDGLHVVTMAGELKVSTKTVRRDMDVLRDLGHATRIVEIDGRTKHQYADRRRRLFRPLAD